MEAGKDFQMLDHDEVKKKNQLRVNKVDETSRLERDEILEETESVALSCDGDFTPSAFR